MARFTIVLHHWFMDSNGFKIIDIEAESKDLAQMRADQMVAHTTRTFNTSAATVIEWGEEVRYPRKLTWRERFLGRIDR